MRPALATLLLVTVTVVTLVPNIGITVSPSTTREKLMREVYSIYRDIVFLEKKGVDTGNLTALLNKTIDYIERGEYDRAEELLSIIRSHVAELKEDCSHKAFEKEMHRVFIAATAAATPILFYLLFPRIYIALWIKIYGEWIADEVS